MAPTKKSSKDTNSAFRKRIKAKVGKKAVQPANVTDTNFKAAALVVRSQDAGIGGTSTSSTAQPLLLLSSRGRALPDLLTHLQQHPAGAVRISAVKGLHDILVQQQQQQTSKLLQRHLNIWMQVCACSMVDSEEQVRTIGLSMLKTVLEQLRAVPQNNQQSASSTTTSTTDVLHVLLQPYRSMLVAFVSSALNSLDRSTRRHGAAVVHVLATHVPSLLVVDMATLLPAFGRLLAAAEDRGVAAAATTTATAGKSKKKQRANKRLKMNNNSNKSAATSSVSTTSGSSSNCGNNPLLQALVALLECTITTSAAKHPTETTAVPEPVSLILQPAGRSRQAVVLVQSHDDVAAVQARRPAPVSLSSSSSTGILTQYLSSSTTQPQRNRSTAASYLCSAACWNELQTRLRDLYVEYSQALSSPPGITSNTSNNDTATLMGNLFLVTRAMRLLWWHSKPPPVTTGPNDDDNEGAAVWSLWKQCHKQAALLLEQFPLPSPPPPQQQSDAAPGPFNVNAETCLILLYMADAVQATAATRVARSSSKNKKRKERRPTIPPTKEWLQRIAAHVKSVLQENAKAIGSSNNSSSILLLRSKPMMEVLRHLLLGGTGVSGSNAVMGGDTTTTGGGEGSISNRTTTSTTTRSPSSSGAAARIPQLTGLFCSLFFPAAAASETETATTQVVTASLARSDMGRSATRLVADLMASCDYNMMAIRQAFGVELVRTLDRLPHYLVHWRIDFLSETFRIVSLLQNMIRRLGETVFASSGNNNSNLLLDALRRGLEPLFLSSDTASCGDATSGGVTGQRAPSILEQFPPELQRMIVSFVTYLGTPTETTVKALGSICAHSHLVRASSTPTLAAQVVLSPAQASYILFSIHAVRKSMKIQTYLGFHFDSTGLMNLDVNSFGGAKETKNDDEVELAASFRKVLTMDDAIADTSSCLVDCGTRKVLPMIQSVLSRLLTIEDGATLQHHEAARIRACLALLAMFALDLKTSNATASVFDTVAADLASKATESATRFIKYSAVKTQDQPFEQIWMRPLIALLSSEPEFFVRLVGHFASQLEIANSTDQARMLTVLHTILRDRMLEKTVATQVNEMLTVTKSIHSMFAEGPQEELSSRLVSHLKVVKELMAPQQRQET